MMYVYSIKSLCRHCAQGRLFVYINMNDLRPYLHCEECEWGWHHPGKIDVTDGFLTLNEDFDSRPATKDEIQDEGWTEFLD